MNSKLNIAILGSRGIPNQYGGFEECAEKLALGLTKQGHQVSVYTVGHHPERSPYWHGIRRLLIRDPERRIGAAGHFIYDLRCNLDSRKRDFHVILHLGYTSDAIWYWLWDKRTIHLVNMDGQEWRRSKYNRMVRRFLKWAEKLATIRSRCLVADSPVIEAYLEKSYGKPVRYIAYGADVPHQFRKETPVSYGLTPGNYDLIIARFIRDNNIEMAIKAKAMSRDPVPLVIIGNQNSYRSELESRYGMLEQVDFFGPVYHKDTLNDLRHFSRLYLHGHSSGGTNPSLLEAMACGSVIACHDNAFNRAVTGDQAYYYRTTEALVKIFSAHDREKSRSWIADNQRKIQAFYQWDRIIEAYEELFHEVVNNP